MDPREPEDQSRDAEGSRNAGALGADRFPHLASPEAGWAVPGVTGLGTVGVGDGGVSGADGGVSGADGGVTDGGEAAKTDGDGHGAGAGVDDAATGGSIADRRFDAGGVGAQPHDTVADGNSASGRFNAAGANANANTGSDVDGEDYPVAGGGRLGVSSEDPDRFLGYDALGLLDELEVLNGRLSAVVGTADAHACRRLAERLTPLLRGLEATYDRAIGQAAAGGGFASSGHGTARTWLADATNVTRTAAGGVLADAEFLDRQPEISAARDAGGMSWQHVAVFRKVLTAQPWREARFPQVADFFVTVAQGVDPAELRRHLQGWAQAVDDQEAPDRPDTPYVERALHLRQVGELWDVRGTLPMLEGATLAGVLDELIAAARRTACTCGQDPCACPKDSTPRATKRADALTALANWATAHRTCLRDDPLLSAGGAQRSRPTILVPLDRLAPHQVPATLADYFASHPPAPRTPHGGCTSCGHSSTGQGSSENHVIQGKSSVRSGNVASGGHPTGDAANSAATGDSTADGTAAGGVAPAGTETVNGVRFTARELNEGLAGLGVSQVRWYAGSESGTLNRRDTEVELCDATVARIITTPEGYPLDVGHDTRVINPGLRAALIVRDGGCIIPGCVTPATWCDGHHVIPWAAGGITALSNLALCCREHHRAIHAGQWTITFTEEGLPQAKSRDIRNLHPYRRRRRR